MASDDIFGRGIESSVKLFENNRGALAKKESFTPFSVPKDNAVEVDEASFGSVKEDLAEYLRDNLKASVEFTDD